MNLVDAVFRQDGDLPWQDDGTRNTRILRTVGIAVVAVLVLAFCAYSFISPLSFDEAAEFATGTGNPIDAAETETARYYVHVVGEVENPGVYPLDAGSRICDAIEAAGGFTGEADESALNLARQIADGEQICVPRIGDVQSGSGGAAASATGSPMVIDGKVNINAADSQTLQGISGIGPATAEKIIADREANGPFASIDDLKRVSGIGDKKLASIADSICIG